MAYAETTDVPIAKSRDDIERQLVRYGASSFGYAWDSDQSVAKIGFVIRGLEVRLQLPLPKRSERRFTHHSRGVRTQAAAEAEWERACRSRWRAALLVIKAKLEAVDVGITTLEKEFLSDTVMNDGRTAYEQLAPAIALMLEQRTAIGGGRQ